MINNEIEELDLSEYICNKSIMIEPPEEWIDIAGYEGYYQIEAKTVSRHELAKQFNISIETISDIVTRRTWTRI